MSLTFGSVCSGIEAASVAWEPLGWKAAWFSEIETFPSAVLAHHYPNIPNLGDMKKIHEKETFKSRAIDVLVGGTPCQSFSVAGLRKGLDDPRGNLALHFLQIVDRKRPRWVVWENVPGVLSSWSNDSETGLGPGGQRNDFDTFTCALAELGYGVAWRTLDAQHFGVPQRRRRVFVVGYFGDWRPVAAVLFESHSLSGNPAPGREAGERVAPSVTGGSQFSCTGNERVEDEAIVCARSLRGQSNSSHREDSDNFIVSSVTSKWAKGSGGPSGDECQNLVTCFEQRSPDGIARESGNLSPTLNRMGGGQREPCVVTHSLRADGFDASEDGTGRGTPIIQIKILQGGEHGKLDDGALESEENLPKRSVRKMWKSEGGGSSQERRLARQSFGKFGASMSKLSHEGASSETEMHTSELSKSESETRLLRKAQPKIREIWDPIRIQEKPTQSVYAVRRLTPRETERLQGFPDDYTLVPYRGKPARDGPRYKAIGNSMAVPCMVWLGQRIQMVEDIL